MNKKRKLIPIKTTAKVIVETQPVVTQTEPEQDEKITQAIEEKTPSRLVRAMGSTYSRLPK
jgi:hypothetical protein